MDIEILTVKDLKEILAKVPNNRVIIIRNSEHAVGVPVVKADIDTTSNEYIFEFNLDNAQVPSFYWKRVQATQTLLKKWGYKFSNIELDKIENL